MQVVIKREDFSSHNYEIQALDGVLKFIGSGKDFILPYSELSDFCITCRKGEKAYFSMISKGKMYEGLVLEPKEIESFINTLKEKMNGIINIEVRKN